jgi:predicted NBD/HSP70 family sugar kinase
MRRASQPGTPRLLRDINERALLDRLRSDGASSRAQLARDTGLSKPTVSNALSNLERAGLVRASGRVTPARGGRSAIRYELNPGAAHVLAVDIGRDWLRVAVADLAGDVVARRDTRNRARSAPRLVQGVGALAHDAVAEADVAWGDVAHSVVGSPGVFDPASGRLRLAPNLPGWGRPGLVDSLRQVLPSVVTLENDANLAAIGEGAYGSGRGVDHFVYVSVGTGIGMGIVVDGGLYRGFGGAAGEVAFAPFPSENLEPSSGSRARTRGILEEATSADAIVRTARSLGMRGRLDAKRIFSAARGGDRLALATVAAEADRLALALGAVAAILDPQLIILGGGVGGNVDLLRPLLEERLARLTPLEPRLVEGELGQDAIVLGAVATALDTASRLVFDEREARAGPAPRPP